MRWYKQDTSIFDRPWTKDPKALAVYLYLHCVAYVNDSPCHGRIIRRGSCPTSRSAIMEGTGLSEYDVKSRLKLLLNSGEILMETSNVGTIITCCDYDSYTTQETLFEQNMSSELPNGLPNQSPNRLPGTPIYNKNIEYKNLRSNDIPSKNERESTKALIYEIKEAYNKKFAGQLIEWQRLSAKMIQKVEICIKRFGRHSVDLVFDEIQNEPFTMGENKTGFRADFDFIFDIDNYEKFLSRYRLRMNKKQAQPSQPQQTSIFDRIEESPQEKRKALLMTWVESEAKRSTERGQAFLTQCYNSGELQRFGIQWQPNNIQQ